MNGRNLARALWAGALLATSGAALAAPVTYTLPEETATLRPGPGLETARNNCSACHSADYLAMQPPKQGRAFWEGEVAKMIKTYKAPIAETDVKAIVDYLAATY